MTDPHLDTTGRRLPDMTGRRPHLRAINEVAGLSHSERTGSGRYAGARGAQSSSVRSGIRDTGQLLDPSETQAREAKSRSQPVIAEALQYQRTNGVVREVALDGAVGREIGE